MRRRVVGYLGVGQFKPPDCFGAAIREVLRGSLFLLAGRGGVELHFVDPVGALFLAELHVRVLHVAWVVEPEVVRSAPNDLEP